MFLNAMRTIHQKMIQERNLLDSKFFAVYFSFCDCIVQSYVNRKKVISSGNICTQFSHHFHIFKIFFSAGIAYSLYLTGILILSKGSFLLSFSRESKLKMEFSQ